MTPNILPKKLKTFPRQTNEIFFNRHPMRSFLFTLKKTEPWTPTNRQKRNVAAVKGWKKHLRRETQNYVLSNGDVQSKYQIVCPHFFETLKMEVLWMKGLLSENNRSHRKKRQLIALVLREPEVSSSCLGWLWLAAAACMHSTTSNCAGSTHYMHRWGTLSIGSICCSWLHLLHRTGYSQKVRSCCPIKNPSEYLTYLHFLHVLSCRETSTWHSQRSSESKLISHIPPNILISRWIFAIISPFSVSLSIATT